MDGPKAIRQWAGYVPKVSRILRMVLAAIRLSVPRHPACTTPIAFPTGSIINTGTQSAVSTARATERDVVIIASMPGIASS